MANEVGTEDRGQARLGIRGLAGRFALDAALILGIEGPDPDVAAAIGITTTFHDAFGP